MFAKLKRKYHKIKRYIIWLHMLYELNTYIAICEPWEKVFLNTLLIVSVSLIFYSTFIYIPRWVYLITMEKDLLPANWIGQPLNVTSVNTSTT